ncbi:MAG TPA: hypothetical protein VK176_06685 [Phycisphaerales bacterium]|nr:hypothetical protein [Phycisphaerales bacterium]
MSFSEMDKRKKITIIVASVGLLFGALLIVNSATDGKLQEVVKPTEKPAVAPVDTAARKKYEADKEKMQERIEEGELGVSGG